MMRRPFSKLNQGVSMGGYGFPGMSFPLSYFNAKSVACSVLSTASEDLAGPASLCLHFLALRSQLSLLHVQTSFLVPFSTCQKHHIALVK